jgi:hypothetical protein
LEEGGSESWVDKVEEEIDVEDWLGRWADRGREVTSMRVQWEGETQTLREGLLLARRI